MPAANGGPIEKSAFRPKPQSTPVAASSGDAGYYQKLTNLFPAEALAIYGTGTAIFGAANPVVIAVGLLILFVLRTVANQSPSGAATDWRAVGVAVVSYLLWATATDAGWLAAFDARLEPTLNEVRKYAAFFGAALVFVAPVLAPPPGQGSA